MQETTKTLKVSFFTALASWAGDLLLYPLGTISTRLKANKYIYHNPIYFAIKSVKSDGLKLYRGIQLSLPGSFVPAFIYFYIYEWGMRKVQYLIEKYKYHQSTKLCFPFFVSAFAQIACMAVYLPVDTIRTRVQLNEPGFKYTNLVTSLKEIAEKEGIGRFYKSMRLYLICRTLEVAATFQSFEMIRYIVGPSTQWLIFNTLFSSAVATTLLNPLEVLITRYAIVDTTKKQLVFSRIVRKITKREGYLGFYKGYPTQLLHNCVFALFWMPIYQILRQKFNLPEDKE